MASVQSWHVANYLGNERHLAEQCLIRNIFDGRVTAGSNDYDKVTLTKPTCGPY